MLVFLLLLFGFLVVFWSRQCKYLKRVQFCVLSSFFDCWLPTFTLLPSTGYAHNPVNKLCFCLLQYPIYEQSYQNLKKTSIKTMFRIERIATCIIKHYGCRISLSTDLSLNVAPRYIIIDRKHVCVTRLNVHTFLILRIEANLQNRFGASLFY